MVTFLGPSPGSWTVRVAGPHWQVCWARVRGLGRSTWDRHTWGGLSKMLTPSLRAHPALRPPLRGARAARASPPDTGPVPR